MRLSREVLLALDPEARPPVLVSFLRQKLARAARLPLSQVDAEQPLTRLGLDSLAAIDFRQSVEDELDVPVPLSELLDGLSIAGLAEHLLGRSVTARRSPEAPLSATMEAPRESPLSHGQRALWFLHHLDTGGAACNIAAAARVSSVLEVGALRGALSALSARHPALRTTFHGSGDEAVQRVNDRLDPGLLVEESSAWSETELEERLQQEAYRPFDLEKGPLLRIAVFRRSTAHDIVLLSVHHIISDFWSLAVLTRELGALYAAETGGPKASLGALPVTYGDYVRWQRDEMLGPEGERLWAFWRDRLEDAPLTLDLPTDRPRPPVQTYHGAAVSLGLDVDRWRRVDAFSHRQDATRFITLLAAFQAFLSRYSGQEDLLVGAPTSGRERSELAGLLGYFVNPVALRADLSGRPSFEVFLGRVKSMVLAAFEHQRYPFPLLAERLQPERDASRSPLFQVMLVLQKAHRMEEEGLEAFALGRAGVTLDLGGLALESIGFEERVSPFELTLRLAEVEGRLEASLQYNTDLFDRTTAARLLGHFAALLRAATDDPGRELSQLPMLAPAERQELLREWNDSRAGEPEAASLHAWIEARAARTPDALAVVCGGRVLTYAALEDRADRLARALRGLGVGPEVPVAIALRRSPELIVGILGILKAEGAYVPMDPSYPRERLSFLLNDFLAGEGRTGPALLLTEEDPERFQTPGAVLPPHLRVLSLAAGLRTWEGGRTPEPSSAAESLAYVIYTSGSTGRPKGSMISVGNVVHSIHARFLRYREPVSSFLLVPSVAFDSSVVVIFQTLCQGGALVLPQDAEAKDPARLRELVLRHRVSHWLSVPTLYSAVLEQGDAGELACLRTVMIAGEAGPPDLADRHRRQLPRTALFNEYGPTEATVWTTVHECGPASDGHRLPIGRAVAHSRVHVADRHRRRVPALVAGELYIGGAGVVRGYLRRPGPTAESFLPDPFGEEPGARLYRTGDLVRYRADGELDFLGRADHQIKLRGFRIELGEVESRLNDHPAVRQAAVAVRQGVAGDRLVAYVDSDRLPAERGSSRELRAFLGERLPDYMVPSVFVLLGSLPLLPNGKVDRKTLPAPAWEDEDNEGAAFRTPEEEVLAGIWSQLLGSGPVGAAANFFELGGHSLTAAQLVSRVRETFGVELPLKAVFEAPTLAAQARRLAAAGRRQADVPSITPAPRDSPPRLSFVQQRLWFLDQMQPGLSVYNVAAAFHLTGALDAAALAAAWRRLLERHEALRTSFPAEGGEPFQAIAPAAETPMVTIDLRAVRRSAADAAWRRWMEAEAARPFDLARGPLLRLHLLRWSGTEATLVAVTHHMVFDGWSMSLLLRELEALYRACLTAEPAALPALPVQYADFVRWQQRWLTREALAADLAYWRRQLADPAVLELPADRPRPSAQSFRGATRPFLLPAALAASLSDLSRRSRTTLFMTILAGFKVLLWRYTHQADVVVGSPVAGRGRLETEGLIGCFVNNLVLRTDLSGDPGFHELLERVRRICLEAYAHQEAPFEQLVEELAPKRDLAHTPLFQVMLVLQREPLAEIELPGLRLRPEPLDTRTAKFDLTISLSPPGPLRETGARQGTGRLTGSVEYGSDLFDAATIDRLSTHFEVLLDGLAARPRAPLAELPLLSRGERHQLAAEWNATSRSYGACKVLHRLIEAQVDRSPAAPAVSSAGDTLSYGELDALANRLAHGLRSLGVAPEVPVAVAMERSLELPVALLAILKAGGAYVPLDPGHPASRLAFVLADSGAGVLLTQARLRSRLPSFAGPCLELDPGWESGLPPASNRPSSGVLPGNAAYLIYTSGSTGRPKAVLIPHEGICNRLLWMQEEYGLAADDRVLQKTPYSFDVSVWEFFWPLLSGAELVVARAEGHRDSAYLAELIRSRSVTTVHFVPPMLQAFLDEPSVSSCRSLRRVVCSGEALPAELRERFFDRLPASELHNLYGPTEASVDVTSWACSAGDGDRTVPIGRPIANTSIRLLDRALGPVPIGVTGELFIGGTGLARGYAGRAGLTARRFLPDPSEETGGRLYRTGDLARRRVDGAVEFLGRSDHQVKVRGLRIELGEIEAALAAHPAVRETVVLLREDRPGDPRLVSYVVPDRPGHGQPNEAETDASDRGLIGELRGLCRRRLPEYMVPAHFVLLSAFPLTVHGKVERRALPVPDLPPESERTAPTSPVGELVAGVWAELLGIERVGPDDDFFELGGHSLSATRVVSRLRSLLGVELSVRELFDAPTVAALAREIEAARAAGIASGAPPLVRVSRHQDLPLSFAQERLWFLDQLEPGGSGYIIHAAIRLSGPLAVSVLARSINRIVHRHEALRTTFASVAGKAVQRISPALGLELPVIDLGRLPAAEREAVAPRLAAAEARRPFDLTVGPLLRVTLLRLAGEDHVVLLAMHHIVSDGWSIGVFIDELGALFRAFSRGERADLAELPVGYADFSVWQRQWLTDEVLERELAYWQGRLAGLEPLRLFTDRPRPLVRSFRGAALPLMLPEALSQALRSLSRRRGATLYMTLLAAFEVLLHRYTGQEDLAVGSASANRNRAETERLIGFFVNTLVMRGDLGGEPTFRELLERVRTWTLEAYVHQDLPFARLVEELHPERSLSHQPLFQVVLALQNAPQPELELPGLTLSSLWVEGGTAPFDLTLELQDSPGRLAGVLRYSTDLFDPSTAARMLRHFTVLLESVVAAPERSIPSLPLLGAGERHQLLGEWNDTASDYGRELCVHELFEGEAERRPEATALVLAGASLSYGELDRCANRLAHHLRGLGVGPEEVVGLALGRSFDLVVGILGILKAGGAYLPVDASYPEERRAFMVRDSSLRVLVSEESRAEAFGGLLDRVVRLDADRETIRRFPAGNPERRTDSRNLAYSMYTSGSTGVPKGVLVTHRSVVRLVRETSFARLGPEEVFLQMAPVSFDASTLEIWGPLANGGRLALFEGEEPSLEELSRTLAEQRVTTLWLTAGLFHLMVDEQPGGLAPLGQLLAGGDKLSVPHVRRALAASPGLRLINGYGPTENTTFTCCHGMSELGEVSSVPIGRPIANTRVVVLDRHRGPAPLGAAGELCAGGDGLARCYGNRPGLTAARFVPDPSSPEPGRRLYRTGDLVRCLPAGRLEFLGRFDAQVKIHGFRIEPGEIEAALAEHPEVSEAAVAVREDTPGERRLVACVVPIRERMPSAGELRGFLQEKLPGYMVPPAFVMLEALPLTPNGKVDRRALPAPEASPPETAFAAPRSPVEEALVSIWSEVLGRARVGIHDDFFDLGGHSLLATQVVSRIGGVFHLELPLRRLFEAPTVAALAPEVERALGAGEGIDRAPPEPVDRSSPLPLSFAQQRLWFLYMLDPGSPAYNSSLAYRVSGELEEAALTRALDEILRRHEALRTTFHRAEGGPVQEVSAPAPFPLPVVDLGELGEDPREAELLRLAAQEERRPFDLARGPVIRATVVRLGRCRQAVLLSLHHIVSDGWSVGVFQRELAALYEAALTGSPSPLAELPLQYADFAVWQRRRLRGEVLESKLAFWRERLAGLDQLELAIDHPRPPVQSFRGAFRPVSLTNELAAGLKALSHRRGVTLYMTLLAAFEVLLHRHTGQTDIAVGSPIANRNQMETEGLIGFFVNTLVMRDDLRGEPTFVELLERVGEGALETYGHQDVPFEMLVDELHPERSLSHQPLFQVVFALQNAPQSRLELPGLSLSPLPVESGVAQFDLALELYNTPGAPEGGLRYRTELFDSSTIVRLGRQFETLLEGVAADPGERLSAFRLLSPGERHQLLGEWNDTASDYGRERCVDELFEAEAERRPAATALVVSGAGLSYGELNRSANRLAHHLRELGVGPEEVVGLALDRSFDLIVGMLGILKAGGAYLPVDASYPWERLDFTLSDSSVELLLTDRSKFGTFAALVDQVVCPDADRETIRRFPADNPERRSSSRNLVYVMYTSGSTGVPKGVCVTHRSVVRLVRETNFARLTPEEVFLQVAPVTFDASTLEIWGPLANGGRLALFGGEEPSLEELSRTLAEQRVTTLWLTAGLFHLMVDEQLDGLAPLRQLLAGGDKLSVAHVRRALEGSPGMRLINGYGPTENTTFTCCHGMSELGEVSSVPIGRPIANTRVVVLDRHQGPVPLGVAGELCTGGDGLARCYGNRPVLTAVSFVPHPSSPEPGRRLYRTGDLVRCLPAGRLEFLGRFDDQVKIHGFRIEPGEIEAALAEHPEVLEVAVAVREDTPGDRRLVAYVVPVPEQLLSAGELRGFLQEKLPGYMVPSAFVVLAALPLTANGKIDRRALPAPETSQQEAAFAAPRSPVEEAMVSMWGEVLGRERVGIHDDFFDLGGHSLLATQVVSRIGRVFHVELPLRRLFESPTVAALAPEVERALGAGEGIDRAPLAPVDRSSPLPLSFAQQRMWFLYLLDPESAAYNASLAYRASGDLAEAALTRALDEIVRRHEALRTTFHRAEGGPVQVVSAPAPLPLPVVDLSELGEQPREAELLGLAAEEERRPFDLARGPVIRATVVRLGRRRQAVLLNLHHIVSDGWSVEIFKRELAALYQAALTGAPSPLAELPLQYADFAVWQRRWLQGEVLESELAFWRERLAGLERLELTVDHPRPPVQGFRGALQPLRLTGELSAGLKALSHRQGVTLYMTLLAAFEVLLHRYTGQADITVGSPIANRNHVETEGLIGFFVNTLVMRGDLRGEPTFLELLERVGEGALETYRHQNVPFEMLVDELHPERSLSHQPLFQVLFALQNAPQSRLALPGLALAPLPVKAGVALFDLALELYTTPGVTEGGLRYRTELFDSSTIVRLGRHFETLLEGVATEPGERLSTLQLLGPGERHQLLGEWNDTASDYGRERCVHELFEDEAERRPEATALVLAGASLSYGELNRSANRLAYHLRELGVGPEEVVGLGLDRSLGLIVGMLGVLKAGGAYLPLDASYPQERLAFTLSDSSVELLLTDRRKLGTFAELVDRAVCLDADREAIERFPAVNPERRTSSLNLVYVMYTSGSTGMPKGVRVTHRGVVRLVRGTNYARLGPDEVFLQIAPVTFDASTLEIWAPLLNRGRLVLFEGEEPSLEALSRTLAEHRVSTLALTAGLFHLMVDEQLGGLAPVRQLLAGGDKVSVSHVRRALAGCPGLRLNNCYGPTENTTFTCSNPMSELGEVASVPIGRPVANTRMMVLDRHQGPVPLGVAGELCAGGDGLARCYGNRPGPTAASFVPHPSSPEPGRRLYRTGDLVRYLTSGSLEFLGRFDAQVKIRGFRVEPGEVEAVLAGYPKVGDVAVIARDDLPGGRGLAAYVVAAGESELSAGELRGFLQEKLPGYMVPSAFAMLEALPLTPNAKVDRRALPAVEGAWTETAYVAPRTPVEEGLAAIWSEVLGIGRVGIEDDFFELGGNSLVAIQLVSRIGEAFRIELPLRSIFQASTVAALAVEVEGAIPGAKAREEPPLVPVSHDGPLPLTFAQQRLWILDRLQPASPFYNMPFAVRFSGFLCAAALERALSEIVQRHEVLRTTFATIDQETVQIISPNAGTALGRIDLERLPPDAREAEMSRLGRAEARRPFDLERGPLIRTTLLESSPEEYLLLANLHHIVADGWSIGVLMQELAALYRAFSRGEASPLPPLPVQYADFAVWQRRQSDALESHLSYWRKQLAGNLRPLKLSIARSLPSTVSSFTSARRSRPLAPELVPELMALARQEGATLFMVLLAAFKALLYRYSEEHDLVVGTPVANRTHRAAEGLIGFFANSLALRTDLAGNPTFRELLGRVRKTTLDAYAHQDLPFESVVEAVRPERRLNRNPLFQVMFVLQNAPMPEFELPGLSVRHQDLESGVAKFDLVCSMIEVSGVLECVVEYACELFDAVAVERLLKHFETLLTAVAESPDTRLSALTMVSPEEHAWALAASVAAPRRRVSLPAELLAELESIGDP